jgi:glycosyltransferase involved in cell wall biosynthesis
LSQLVTHINSYFITNALHAELIEKIDEKGLKQSVFVPVPHAGLLNKFVPDELLHGVITYKHCFNSFDKYLWPLKMLKIWLEFKKFYLKQPPSIIHAHTLIVNGLIAYLAFRKWGTPYIVTVRNSDLNVFLKFLPFFRGIGLKILKSSSGVIILSPIYLSKHLANYYPKDRFPDIFKKAVVIPNGISDFWHKNISVMKNLQPERTIVFSGKIKRNKNLRTLIKACSLLDKSGYKLNLKVLGDGPQLNYFRKRKSILKIEFYGHLSTKDEILEKLRQSDILIVPSFVETFGLVYPEAMSQGLPVIYSRNQGFDGFFPDGHIGYAVDPRSPKEIAEKIRLIFSDYSRLSNNASEAAKEFSWDNVTERMMQLYGHVLKQKQ